MPRPTTSTSISGRIWGIHGKLPRATCRLSFRTPSVPAWSDLTTVLASSHGRCDGTIGSASCRRRAGLAGHPSGPRKATRATTTSASLRLGRSATGCWRNRAYVYTAMGVLRSHAKHGGPTDASTDVPVGPDALWKRCGRRARFDLHAMPVLLTLRCSESAGNAAAVQRETVVHAGR